jgi:fluoroquinolone transport system permease protein
MAAVDRRTLLGDRVLLLVLGGVPLLALAVRWLRADGAQWLLDRWGFDIVPYLPVVWAFVLVVHAPLMLGAVSGLVFLEGRDVGADSAVQVTRASLQGLLVWRLSATAGLTAAAVLVGVWIAGASHASGWTGLLGTAVCAAAVAAFVAMLMAAFGRDRVQGMAVMKLMGLPFYAPLALGIMSGPIVLSLLVIPSGWAVQSFLATTALGSGVWAAGGTAWSVLLTGLLARRLLRRQTA